MKGDAKDTPQDPEEAPQSPNALPEVEQSLGGGDVDPGSLENESQGLEKEPSTGVVIRPVRNLSEIHSHVSSSLSLQTLLYTCIHWSKPQSIYSTLTFLFLKSWLFLTFSKNTNIFFEKTFEQKRNKKLLLLKIPG